MRQYDSLAKEILVLKQYGPAELWKMPEATAIFNDFKQLLNEGKIRAAERDGYFWKVNLWVKEGILLGMRLGRLVASESGVLNFIDKDTYPLKTITLEDKIRIVPGGFGSSGWFISCAFSRHDASCLCQCRSLC